MLEYKKGEVQYVKATVRPETANEIAVIKSASFEFTDDENKTIIQQGDCEIEGDELRALLDFSEEGIYTLTITVQVGKETIIGDKIISVTE